MTMDPTKPLWKSKTFWAGLAAQLVGLAQLFQWITADDAQFIMANSGKAIEGAFTFAAGSGAILGRLGATQMIGRLF